METIFKIFKASVVTIATWLIASYVFVWNGKDKARAFIGEVVDAKTKTDRVLIFDKLKSIEEDTKMIKEHLINNHRR